MLRGRFLHLIWISLIAFGKHSRLGHFLKACDVASIYVIESVGRIASQSRLRARPPVLARAQHLTLGGVLGMCSRWGKGRGPSIMSSNRLRGESAALDAKLPRSRLVRVPAARAVVLVVQVRPLE